MKLFFTSSTQHLKQQFHGLFGSYTLKKFSDGEWYVHIIDDVAQQNVLVIAATNTPADNYIELLLLLDALQRAGAYITLVFMYYGYARQDRIQQPGEALSAQVLAYGFKQFTIKNIIILHVHSELLHNFLNFRNYIPYDYFYTCAQDSDIIVAPDKGAYTLATVIADKLGREALFLQKTHPHQEESVVTLINGNVAGKNVLLVDDMISTAGTIIHASTLLKEQGALRINIAVTHGIFAHDALEKLQQSSIETIYITNSLSQPVLIPKIKVVTIIPWLEQYLIQQL